MVTIGTTKIEPTKIICVGTNYMDHIVETKLDVPKEPVLFPKTPNCLVLDKDPIIYPKWLYHDRKSINRLKIQRLKK